MKGKPQVVQMLNEVLVAELTAVNQYFLGAKMVAHRGYERLGHKLYTESLEEMRHAEKLIDRILFLDGVPNVQKLEKVKVAASPVEQLEADLEIEKRSVGHLNRGIELCRARGDHGSAELLQGLLPAAESHVEWLETQLELAKALGVEQYLAQQVKKDG
jgi:bacterioferritin